MLNFNIHIFEHSGHYSKLTWCHFLGTSPNSLQSYFHQKFWEKWLEHSGHYSKSNMVPFLGHVSKFIAKLFSSKVLKNVTTTKICFSPQGWHHQHLLFIQDEQNSYKIFWLDMSRLMTNQQNGLCAQWRLRSAWASAQSDQSLRCPHEAT